MSVPKVNFELHEWYICFATGNIDPTDKDSTPYEATVDWVAEHRKNKLYHREQRRFKTYSEAKIWIEGHVGQL